MSLSMSVSSSSSPRAIMMVVPWSPIVPLKIILSPDLRARGGDAHGRFDDADARRVDEDLVGAALLHDFRVAGHDLYSRLFGRLAHRVEHASQVLDGETFFENETGGEVERARAAHGEVVDRAVDGEAADVAAGKEDRA